MKHSICFIDDKIVHLLLSFSKKSSTRNKHHLPIGKINIPDNVLIVDIPQRFDFAGQQKEIYEPYYGRLIRFIEENYTLTGEFENGRSGKVIKYERETV